MGVSVLLRAVSETDEVVVAPEALVVVDVADVDVVLTVVVDEPLEGVPLTAPFDELALAGDT